MDENQSTQATVSPEPTNVDQAREAYELWWMAWNNRDFAVMANLAAALAHLLAPDGRVLYFQDHFGVCPTCGKTDGCLHVHRDEWFVCHEHRCKWCAGSNLFSSWREMTEEEFERNAATLAAYTEVQPVHPPKNAPKATETATGSKTGPAVQQAQTVNETKAQLLERDAQGKPTRFYQFAVVVGANGRDDITESSVWELGERADVCVLVPVQKHPSGSQVAHAMREVANVLDTRGFMVWDGMNDELPGHKDATYAIVELNRDEQENLRRHVYEMLLPTPKPPHQLRDIRAALSRVEQMTVGELFRFAIFGMEKPHYVDTEEVEHWFRPNPS